eukprot:6212348-Pleurochrysis_carterae.AAC.1
MQYAAYAPHVSNNARVAKSKRCDHIRLLDLLHDERWNNVDRIKPCWYPYVADREIGRVVAHRIQEPPRKVPLS